MRFTKFRSHYIVSENLGHQQCCCDNHGNDSPQGKNLHGGKKENAIVLGSGLKVVKMSRFVDDCMKIWVADHRDCCGIVCQRCGQNEGC